MLNKLRVLDTARNLDLTIPDYILSNSKKSIVKFLKEKGERVIIKPISDTATIQRNNKVYTTYTSEIIINDLHDANVRNYPVFCQQKIEKEFEIRSFYLDGKFSSMAIFSQMEDTSIVDFRASENKKNVRRTPYILPEEVEQKLRKLMQAIGLNTGSIDLIQSTDGEIYFLEVNPAGQIGMTSTPCNYYLERQIAKFLIGIE